MRKTTWIALLQGAAAVAAALLVASLLDGRDALYAMAVVAIPAASGGVVVEGGRAFWSRSSGRWAGEQLMRAMAAGRPISPKELRVADVISNDQWKIFDEALVAEAQMRLRGVADLIGAGLVMRVANGLAKTVLEYQTVTDMDPATVSLDGVTRSENDRVEFDTHGLPLPITHKDFYLNLRALMASRVSGEPLDTTHIRAAGRKIAEETERMLFQGGKIFGGYEIYGYTTHPNRNQVGYGTNGSWSQVAKTGDNILSDVATMVNLMEGDRMFGPYWLYVSSPASLKLSEDFKASSDKTIRQRILEMENVSQIRVVDQMPADEVVLVQPTADVVQLVEGEPLQTVQWDIEGGFQINFKAFQILVPLIRADAQGRSGIVHVS